MRVASVAENEMAKPDTCESSIRGTGHRLRSPGHCLGHAWRALPADLALIQALRLRLQGGLEKCSQVG